MQEKLDEIRRSVQEQLLAAGDSAQVEQIRVSVLGRKGELTALLKGMGKLSPEERPVVGQQVNALRQEIEAALAAKEAELQEKEKQARLEKEALDVSIPGKPVKVGNVHPLSSTLEKIITIFTGLGFSVVEGPEVELDHYNFELLNLPKNHPARDAQDTFYIDDNIVLRTHTSPVQARIMTTRKPPIRIVCPGRAYRVDEADATHSPVFQQIEGLVIDEGISMSDLKGTLDAFAARWARTERAWQFIAIHEDIEEISAALREAQEALELEDTTAAALACSRLPAAVEAVLQKEVPSPGNIF